MEEWTRLYGPIKDTSIREIMQRHASFAKPSVFRSLSVTGRCEKLQKQTQIYCVVLNELDREIDTWTRFSTVCRLTLADNPIEDRPELGHSDFHLL